MWRHSLTPKWEHGWKFSSQNSSVMQSTTFSLPGTTLFFLTLHINAEAWEAADIYIVKVHLHREKAIVLFRWIVRELNLLLITSGSNNQRIFSLSPSLWLCVNGPLREELLCTITLWPQGSFAHNQHTNKKQTRRRKIALNQGFMRTTLVNL